MKRGKLSETVKNRSIQKLIDQKPGKLRSSASFSGRTKDFVRRSVFHAANALAAAGGTAEELELQLLLPEKTEERELKEMIREAAAAADLLHAGLQADAEVTDAVVCPCAVTFCCGSGSDRMSMDEQRKTYAGMDIVLTRWIGMETTAILAKEKYTELRKFFSEDFIRNAGELDRTLSAAGDAAAAAEAGVPYMQALAEGGIFETLWKMGEETGCGMDVDLRMIPIRQETVEICEVFDINPYESLSGGALLLLAANGQQIVEELAQIGIPAKVIGRTCEGKERILRNQEQIRYLDKYRQDEIYKVI
ncbi:MAG: AIR synthase-related protein [Eubacteriales bacterium]|nr:AIR synthase-related protein [Eubacteriales bacterium]